MLALSDASIQAASVHANRLVQLTLFAAVAVISTGCLLAVCRTSSARQATPYLPAAAQRLDSTAGPNSAASCFSAMASVPSGMQRRRSSPLLSRVSSSAASESDAAQSTTDGSSLASGCEERTGLWPAESMQRASSQESDGGWVAEALWRTRFGVIDGLKVGELLGVGAYGRVHRGRWNGAAVAVKVVEHRLDGGDLSPLIREPLLCMSVSHPNCITTYKLCLIRLLRDANSAEPEPAVECAIPTPVLSSINTDSASSGGSAASSGVRLGRRVLRSLLSGAEAEEVEDAFGCLLPGTYETWIVSECCEHGTLSDVLAQKPLRLPDGTANMAAIYLCLLDVASGLQYLHSLGIIHGDLKPANVLLKSSRHSSRGFTCKLADFGLSRMLDGRATYVETGSYGTPTHAAPELLREGRLSPAGDVFAFGVLAWELVAGEEAYRGLHPMQIIAQVTQQSSRPPLPQHCPPALAALMERCWQEEPADRPSFTDIVPELLCQLQHLRRQQKQ